MPKQYSNDFQRLAVRYAVCEAKSSSRCALNLKRLGFEQLALGSIVERKAYMKRAKAIKAQPCATFVIQCNMTSREFYQFDGSEGDMRIWLARNGYDYRSQFFDTSQRVYRVMVNKIRA